LQDLPTTFHGKYLKGRINNMLTDFVDSTVNPIVYSVMSRRYRVAFRELLCGKAVGAYYNSGFARDHSSFRESTATSLGNNINYDRVHSVSCFLKTVLKPSHSYLLLLLRFTLGQAGTKLIKMMLTAYLQIEC